MIAASKDTRRNLQNLRKIVAQERSSSKRTMSIEEIVRKTRQIRKKLWEEKIAAGSRHK